MNEGNLEDHLNEDDMKEFMKNINTWKKKSDDFPYATQTFVFIFTILVELPDNLYSLVLKANKLYDPDFLSPKKAIAAYNSSSEQEKLHLLIELDKNGVFDMDLNTLYKHNQDRSYVIELVEFIEDEIKKAELHTYNIWDDLLYKIIKDKNKKE